MEKSNFVIELMNMPVDAALFDLEKRLSSEELGELTDSFIYSVSSRSKEKKSLQGVVLQQRTTRRAAIHASQETRIYRCRNFGFGAGRGPLQAFTSIWAD
jgi:hypothetical protein